MQGIVKTPEGVNLGCYTGFTWKIINLMLSLQRTGIKSKTKDNTGYYVRSPIQEATPADFTEKHKHAANFHIWLQRHSSEFCHKHPT